MQSFADIGYVSTQDVIALILELRKGHVPDAAMFLEGVNDTFAACRSAPPRWTTRWLARFSTRICGTLIWSRPWPADTGSGPFSSGSQRSFTKRHLSRQELAWYETLGRKFTQSGSTGPPLDKVRRALVRRLQTGRHDNVHDLSGVFDDATGTIYIDEWHLTETGNEKITGITDPGAPWRNARSASQPDTALTGPARATRSASGNLSGYASGASPADGRGPRCGGEPPTSGLRIPTALISAPAASIAAPISIARRYASADASRAAAA